MAKTDQSVLLSLNCFWDLNPIITVAIHLNPSTTPRALPGPVCQQED